MTDATSDPLKRVADQLKKCVKCGACRANCPAFTAFGREPAVARGKVALAQHILKDDIELDDQTYLAMSKCLLCGSCVEKCPNEVPTDEIVIAAREALAQKRGLTTFHAAVGQVINIGNDSREVSIMDLAKLIKAKAKSSSEIVLVPYAQAYEEGFEDMPRRVPDLTKIRGIIGYEPKVDLDGLLDRVIEHFMTDERRV